MASVSALPAQSQSVASNDLLTFCKASADQLRLDVLRVLREESFGVMELCRIFDTGQPGMSHHLKVLANAGLVETRREGNSIFYRRSLIATGSSLNELVRTLFAAIDRIPLTDDMIASMAAIHEERAISSRQFFEKNADRLGENQSLIADYHQYSGCVRDLINNEQIPDKATALEIGPGESELINLLAETFAETTALDNSEEMLRKAQGALTPSLTERVDFVLGEPSALVKSGKQFDFIVLNMVLHHLPSPAMLFRTASKLMREDGRLLIIDLKPHNQDWARDICGDLWLGFEPVDIDEWATDADLEKGQSVFLGLKNGFQVQVRLFHRPRSNR